MSDLDKKKEKSLRFSMWDGFFACSMTGLIQDYLTPFLLLLGGQAKHVGMLSSLPNFAAAMSQLKSPDITAYLKSRRMIINVFVFLQAIVLIPIAWMAFGKINSPYLFILLVTLCTALGAIALPPWGSLMSDLVPEKKRGEYFGWRQRWLGIVTVVATFAAGIILHFMQRHDIYLGFAILFGAACLFRFISWFFLTCMYEPPLEHKKEHAFTFLMFLSRLKQSNFAQFVLFVAMLNFCVNLAAPFFAVFMLRDLQFSYFLYSALTVTTPITVILLISRWGKHADKIGNLKVMKMTAPIIATLPLWWILTQKPAILFLVQILSGFAWAGFNLCASNFIYDSVTPEKRTRCIAYFNVLNGIALCCGALIGGFLVDHLPALRGNRILMLFFISSMLRLIISIFMPRRLKEVRPVEDIRSYQLFFSMIGMRPILGIDRKTIQY